jgi:hypothetical protein
LSHKGIEANVKGRSEGYSMKEIREGYYFLNGNSRDLIRK